MNTADFLSLILPSQGERAVVFIGGKYPWQQFYKKNDIAAAVILQLDAKDTGAVYHGCATFKDATSRKAENVHSVKSFWLDVDVGPGKAYVTQEDALAAVELFSKQLDLFPPFIVSSGRGLHVYYVLELAVTPAQWLPVAAMLKAATVKAGLGAGPERTTDIASVLRPIGTTHRKHGELPVEMLKRGKIGDYGYFKQQLVAYVGESPVAPVAVDLELGPRPKGVNLPVSNDDMRSGTFSVPTIDALLECAVIREFKESQGNIEEPLWRACLGVVRYAEDGERYCHEWSAGHANYTPEETDAKLKRIPTGATKCSTFEAHRPDACAACPFRGKVNSPVSLKKSQEVPQAITSVAPAAPVVLAIPKPPEPFIHDGGALPHQKKIYMRMKDEEGGEDAFTQKLVSSMLVYGTGLIENDQTQATSLIVQYHPRAGETKQIEIDVSTIAEGGAKLRSTLGKVCIMAEQGSDTSLRQLLMSYVNQHRMASAAAKAYTQFGWQGNDFLIGHTLFQAGGIEKRVMVAPSIRSYAEEFEPKGSLNVWQDLVDRAYNHPGWESWQFAVLAGLAAPMVKMFDEYGGLFVYMHTEDSGKGKTTVERVALSAWCRWRKLQQTDGQATQNALYSLMSTVGSMPFVLDEMTHMDNAVVGQMLHIASAGTPKLRLDKTSQLQNSGDMRWDTIILGSGNRLLSEKLAQFRANSEAERARVWEYTLTDIDKSPIKGDEAADLFPELLANYGNAGRALIRYIVDNKPWVEQRLKQNCSALSAKLGFTQAERYWRALCGAVMTTHEIAYELGIVKFPMLPMLKWMRTTLHENRASMTKATAPTGDMLSRMLSDLWGTFLVTRGVGNNYTQKEAFVDQHPAKGLAVNGRVVVPTPTDAGTVYIRREAIKKWCDEKKVSETIFVRDAVKKGIVKAPKKRFRLGQGVGAYAGIAECECLQVDYAAALGNVAPAPAPKLVVVSPPKGKAQ